MAINDLPLQTLVALGLTQADAQQKLNELNIRINAAIIDDVLASLTAVESEKLKNDLTAEPVNAETTSQKLKNACLTSANKPDADKIASNSRAVTLSKFWEEVSRNATDEQRQKSAALILESLEAIKEKIGNPKGAVYYGTGRS